MIEDKHWKPMAIKLDGLTGEQIDKVKRAWQDMGYTLGVAAHNTKHNILSNLDLDDEVDSTVWVGSEESDGEYLLSYNEFMNIAYGNVQFSSEDTVTMTFTLEQLVILYTFLGNGSGVYGLFELVDNKLLEYNIDAEAIAEWSVYNTDHPTLNISGDIDSVMEIAFPDNSKRKQRKELEKQIAELQQQLEEI